MAADTTARDDAARRERALRRILVGLDASPSSLAALDAAIRLAAELDAELAALFVEDVNMLRLAGLPFSRFIDPSSTAVRRLDPGEMEGALRAQAERMRRRLAEAAGARRIAWSFRVARGDVAREILAAAREADLLSLGFVGSRPTGGLRAGSLARRAAREAPRSVLLFRGARAEAMPVAVCLEEGPAAEPTLATAAALARAHRVPLTVIIFADDDATATRIEGEAAELLSGRELTVRYVRVPEADRRDLRAALRAAAGGVLVLSATGDLVESKTLESLLEHCSCSLLLVR